MNLPYQMTSYSNIKIKYRDEAYFGSGAKEKIP